MDVELKSDKSYKLSSKVFKKLCTFYKPSLFYLAVCWEMNTFDTYT